MQVNIRELNGLIQDYIDTAVSIQYCSGLDDMRKYDWSIDAHDAWVEHAYDRLDELRENLANQYDIHLKDDTFDGNPQE